MPRELGIYFMIAGVVVLGIGNVLYLRGMRREKTPLGTDRPPVHYVLAGLVIGGILLLIGFFTATNGTT